MNRLEKEIINDEGLKLKPYQCTAGKLTIGIGRNLDEVGISEAEAVFLLRNDISRVRKELSSLGWYRTLDERRKEVIVNMCFNLGLSRLNGFYKMIACIEQGDYSGAANEMLDSKWSEQVGERAVRLANIMRSGL